MPVFAVINRKGGSGKSTLSTHIASYLANRGASVMLGDIDRQQSSKTWLRLRGSQHQPILNWAVDHNNIRRLPVGVNYAVIDTPGGLHGFELAKVVMFADYIVVPVCASIFDRESAGDCLAELKKLPKVASGRCKLGVVGMRMEKGTEANHLLRQWALAQQVPVITSITEAREYVSCIEEGLTVFDLDTDSARRNRIEWHPLLQWLAPELTQHLVAPQVSQNASQLNSANSQAKSALSSDHRHSPAAPMLAQTSLPQMPRESVTNPNGDSLLQQPVARASNAIRAQASDHSVEIEEAQRNGRDKITKNSWFDASLIPAFLRSNK
jgi:chromosome partitioning protein